LSFISNNVSNETEEGAELIKYQEEATGWQLIGDGVVVLLTEGYILGANLAGREYLGLLANVGVGDTLSYLGGRSLAELLEAPPSPEIGHEVILERPFRRVFDVVAQPAPAGGQTGDWVLIIRDLARVRAREGYVQPHQPVRTVIHWPPASPRTSALP
jgi:PAS domain-containing protein